MRRRRCYRNHFGGAHNGDARSADVAGSYRRILVGLRLRPLHFPVSFYAAQKEWANFVDRRIKEDVAFLIQCRSPAEMARVYADYLQEASSSIKNNQQGSCSAGNLLRSISRNRRKIKKRPLDRDIDSRPLSTGSLAPCVPTHPEMCRSCALQPVLNSTKPFAPKHRDGQLQWNST